MPDFQFVGWDVLIKSTVERHAEKIFLYTKQPGYGGKTHFSRKKFNILFWKLLR
ncbi:Hypothetical protein CpCap5W_0516 [Corynebacterium pseudotuberculosis]|nr:Hypothetical protein CpPAT10_0492a [Corynebacterium pseudotuberculosis PAT10]AEX38965.1 Hypothetical protein Cp3995_0496 [Corynebacterium pseudotuberculosis 3/99-5]AFF21643.1 Hypothetical protein CpP54B96_0495 [Corynebacterium pseudotuberculosis P54B96]AIG06866.1 hypothetical protein CPTA_01037 [Corynebacterium pseudotuberculosis]AIG08552.1 hypothetical protein CPTB_00496 [Corynebacterium pseudotuberculosis]